MPLIKSASKKAVSSNIRAEMAAGKPQDQAVAIALSVARRARKKADGGAVEEEDRLLKPPRTPAQMPDAWNDAVRKVAKGVVDTVAAPGRAMQGKYAAKPERPGLWSEEDEFRHQHAQRQQVEDAASMSMDVAGARFPFAKAGEAGIFGGKLAATADKAALAKAEEMAGRGLSKDRIFAETGWFQGADGNWRFEIPDYKSRLLNNNPVPGFGRSSPATVLEHPELYAAYPDLDAIRMARSEPPGHAYHLAGPGVKETIGLPHNKTDADRMLLLHELQHAIQGREGFARGASSQEILPLAEQQVRDYLGRLVRDRENIPRERLMELFHDAPDPKKLAFEAYRRHAGEVEARAVERRKDYTPLTLKRIPPWVSEDIPREKQIVRGHQDVKKSDGGAAMANARKYAAGGQIRGPGPTFFQRDANRKLAQQGLIKSAIPGRTDKHKVRVPAGSYVLPADFVSHIGQNNTLAGDKFLKKRFGSGGGVAFARGGRAPDPVDIVVAGGEWLVHPEAVAKIGGGSLERGHEILDREVMEARKNHIGTLAGLEGPKKG